MPTAEIELRRAVASCLLWENNFYEDGVAIAERIAALIPMVPPATCFSIAAEVRSKHNLRHVPLLIAREMARVPTHRPFVRTLLPAVIQRADELTEFLAIYWKDGKQPLANAVKGGLAEAFTKFSEYDLAKYNRDNKIRLRDVMFLVHPSPKTEWGAEGDVTRASAINRPNYKRSATKRHVTGQGDVWRRLVADELATPDTWEVALSAKDGIPRKDKWTRLLSEKKMGALAILRNLRNMTNDAVSDEVIAVALAEMNVSRVLPFRFVAAAIHAPRFEPNLEAKMFESVKGRATSGKTAVVVDVSGSMQWNIADKSDMTREDAANALAMITREIYTNCDVYSFSDKLAEVPPRRGFALRDAIRNSQAHNSTMLGGALQTLFQRAKEREITYERLIVVTDEQTQDRLPNVPNGTKGYIINVAPYQIGVGHGQWTTINGFSESVFDFLNAYENLT